MKVLSYGVLAIVFLVVVLLGVFIIPAHLQIRQMNIELPVPERLLELGAQVQALPRSLSFVTTSEQSGPIVTLGHVGILVSWADGRQLLIDAGMDREAAIAFGKPLETLYSSSPALAYGPIEEQLGDEINNISGIVFTHLHSDHTAGISSICTAMNEPALIYQTIDQYEQQNHLTSAGRALIDSSACKQRQLGSDLIKALEDFPGVFALSAGGHTPGSTIFAVFTEEQLWLFSGDLTNAMANIHNNEGKGWLYSTLVVPENTILLERWRRWLKDLDARDAVSVIPAHDIEHLRASGIPELTPVKVPE